MDPDRKRKVRLVVALSAAVLLAVALIYTSFSASTEAREPSEVLAAGPSDESYQVAGEVVSESRQAGRGRDFRIANEEGQGKEMRVSYPAGIVPDPYRVGRDVVITGRLNDDGVFVGQKDSLITKCPSKFAAEVEDTTNVQFEG